MLATTMLARKEAMGSGPKATSPEKKASARKKAARIFKLAAFALSITAAILIILVLTAGSSPGALTNLYLIKVSAP